MHSTLILGGGMAGLSAGYALGASSIKASPASSDVIIVEAHEQLGGLSRTIKSGEFRYDLGGHRFYTHDLEIDELVRNLLGNELINVSRTSKIFMDNKFFDYPLKPTNAILGLGPAMVLKILLDYTAQRIKNPFDRRPVISLEDWVVRKFGRTMFNIYFKKYSEKVWGLPCNNICQSWVSKRIQGLSLAAAVKNALFKFSGSNIPTLTDNFSYPALGIGRITDRFAEEVGRDNTIHKSTTVRAINHDNRRVKSVMVDNCKSSFELQADEYISTIPLNALINGLNPAPPAEIMDAVNMLGFRDLVIVALKVDRPTVTDLSWLYVPESSIPFGRIHEPKIWSKQMAPEDKTLLVVEYFCFKNDGIWSMSDDELHMSAIRGLEQLGLVEAQQALGSDVLRIPNAYPVFSVGYEDNVAIIYDYLKRFDNLHIAGRSGTYQYQNMDHAIRSGIEAAEVVAKRYGITGSEVSN